MFCCNQKKSYNTSNYRVLYIHCLKCMLIYEKMPNICKEKNGLISFCWLIPASNQEPYGGEGGRQRRSASYVKLWEWNYAARRDVEVFPTQVERMAIKVTCFNKFANTLKPGVMKNWVLFGGP